MSADSDAEEVEPQQPPWVRFSNACLPINVTKRDKEVLKDTFLDDREKWCRAAKQGEWDEIHQMITANNCERHINAIYWGDDSLNTALHYAALLDAPSETIELLLASGATYRNRNKDGKTALDLAEEKKRKAATVALFKPKADLPVNKAMLQALEKNMQNCITKGLEVTSGLLRKDHMLLPQIEVLWEARRSYLEIPGHYGGCDFKVFFDEKKSEETYIIVNSWCRVAGGSERRHKITKDKYEELEFPEAERFC